jgi:hypothetical protein
MNKSAAATLPFVTGDNRQLVIKLAIGNTNQRLSMYGYQTLRPEAGMGYRFGRWGRKQWDNTWNGQPLDDTFTNKAKMTGKGAMLGAAGGAGLSWLYNMLFPDNRVSVGNSTLLGSLAGGAGGLWRANNLINQN